MPFFRVSVGAASAQGTLLHTTLEWAGVSQKAEGRRRNGEGLCTGTGTGGAFVEGYLDVGAGRIKGRERRQQCHAGIWY